MFPKNPGNPKKYQKKSPNASASQQKLMKRNETKIFLGKFSFLFLWHNTFRCKIWIQNILQNGTMEPCSILLVLPYKSVYRKNKELMNKLFIWVTKNSNNMTTGKSKCMWNFNGVFVPTVKEICVKRLSCGFWFLHGRIFLYFLGGYLNFYRFSAVKLFEVVSFLKFADLVIWEQFEKKLWELFGSQRGFFGVAGVVSSKAISDYK